jgi:tripartite-type tricarboxylate transporter receptor subunit TctC
MEDDMNRRSLVIALATLTAAVAPKLAHTESYPSRPVTLVVPYAAGGTFDVIARIVATRMGELLGQPVIVENTTGAGGVVGVTRVMHAKPDGYTILLGTVGTHAYNQWIYKKRRYDALEDFTPVTLFSEQPMVLEVRKDLPANSFPEFIALLKKDGSKMQFGSAGAGTTTHLACALLNAKIGANVTHVPYRGSAPATNDLIGGQIDYVCGNIGAAIGLIKANRVKALAMLSKERSSLMPELPTPHEMGIADYDVTTWTALFLPKGAPREVVAKLAEVTQATMETPAIKTRMLEIGVTGVSKDRQSPEYLSKYVAEEIARWEAPIKSGGLQVE